MGHKVFLSYAREDEAIVTRLYESLTARGLEVWFDKVSLKAGRWRPQILRAISQSRYFIACLSHAALRRLERAPGFQDHELTTAYEIAMAQSEDRFAIVPVRLEDTGRGDHRISVFQQFDLFGDEQSALDRLARFLEAPRATAGPTPTASPAADSVLRAAIYGKMKIAFETKEFSKALTLLAAAEELGGETYETLNDRAAVLWFLGKPMDALSAIDQAIAIRSDKPLMWINRGNILRDLGKLIESLDCYTKAMSLDPHDTAGLLNSSSILLELGQHAQALEQLNQLIRLDPKAVNAYAMKGIILSAIRDDNGAIEASRQAILLDHRLATAHETLGIAHLRSGHGHEALVHFQIALDLGQITEMTLSGKANALIFIAFLEGRELTQTERAEAVAAADRALEMNPDSAHAGGAKHFLNTGDIPS